MASEYSWFVFLPSNRCLSVATTSLLHESIPARWIILSRCSHSAYSGTSTANHRFAQSVESSTDSGPRWIECLSMSTVCLARSSLSRWTTTFVIYSSSPSSFSTEWSELVEIDLGLSRRDHLVIGREHGNENVSLLARTESNSDQYRPSRHAPRTSSIRIEVVCQWRISPRTHPKIQYDLSNLRERVNQRTFLGAMHVFLALSLSRDWINIFVLSSHFHLSLSRAYVLLRNELPLLL